MKWDLSFCEAELNGNELIVQLKKDRRTIEHLFKVYGKYFKFRAILVNFGYNIFRKALKNRILMLMPDRIEQFKSFFNAIQAEESKLNQLGGTGHAESSPANMWQVDTSEKIAKKSAGLSFCSKCGTKLPENLGDARFCPECGAPIVS